MTARAGLLFGAVVYDEDYQGRVSLDAYGDQLAVTVDHDGSAVTVSLDDESVRRLRLALARYERARTAHRQLGGAQ